jgi:transposase
MSSPRESLERQEGWEKREPGVEAGGASPASPPGAVHLRRVPDPEVEPRAQRRRFTGAYKLEILREAQMCQGPGEIGALLRREGLYASHLAKWRKLKREGGEQALGQPRGRKPDPDTVVRQQLRQLERDNQRLQRKLKQAEQIIEVQKKLSEILGISLEPQEESNE